MNRRILLIGVALALALAGGFAVMRGDWTPQGAVAQSPKAKGKSAVTVEVARAVKKKVPVRIDLLGNVTPIAAVAVKPRIDSEITEVHFSDGAIVRKGDMLFTLDHRAIDAQIRQTQGILNGAKAQLEQATRDVERYDALVAKNATTMVTLNNAKTQVNIFTAAVESNTAQLELLRVQRDFTFIRAPITGRVSMANVKVGNYARQADPIPLATIIQVAPVYVTFALPQRSLPELRQAITNETAIHPSGRSRRRPACDRPGDHGREHGRRQRPARCRSARPCPTPTNCSGRDAGSGAADLPRGGVGRGAVGCRSRSRQAGPFVFVVKNGVATVQPVKIARVLETEYRCLRAGSRATKPSWSKAIFG